jgi:hypothetical protein
MGLTLLVTGCTNTLSSAGDKSREPASKTEVCCAAHELLTTLFSKFPFDENGPFELPSNTQVCVARKKLAKFDSGRPIPSQMKGEILIDGVLLTAHGVPREKQEITIRVDKIVFGNDDTIPQELTITSPQERYGGITVAVGEQYRLLVVPINGKYYSWATTGSMPIDRAFSGFYKCTEKQKPIPASKP